MRAVIFRMELWLYSFTIPAGSDYTNLEEADFYGFMYLFGVFGGVVVE